MVERPRDQEAYADHEEHQATTVYPAADVRNACKHLLEGNVKRKAEQNLCTEDEEARLVECELELPFGERRHGERTAAMTWSIDLNWRSAEPHAPPSNRSPSSLPRRLSRLGPAARIWCGCLPARRQ